MNRPSNTPLLGLETAQGVHTITLGAAPAHALSLAMIDALQEAFEAAGSDPDVRVIVIDGPGRIFCAGHDMKEMSRHRHDADAGAAFMDTLFSRCSDMMLTLAHLRKPTIAIVDGIATAAGLQLSASCDMVFASPTAEFCLPGVTNGGFCTTPAVAVSRVIGKRALMEMMLSGETMDSDWALRHGLITRIIPSERLSREAHSFAKTLAARNPTPIQDGKAALLAHQTLSLEDAYKIATPVMVAHLMDEGRQAKDKASKFYQSKS